MASWLVLLICTRAKTAEVQFCVLFNTFELIEW